MGGFISRFSIQFSWSTCLFLCKHHTIVLFYIALLEASSFVVVLKSALAIWDIARIYMKFTIVFSNSMENVIGMWVGIMLNL
jgi:hypothetical protein